MLGFILKKYIFIIFTLQNKKNLVMWIRKLFIRIRIHKIIHADPHHWIFLKIVLICIIKVGSGSYIRILPYGSGYDFYHTDFRIHITRFFFILHCENNENAIFWSRRSRAWGSNQCLPARCRTCEVSLHPDCFEDFHTA